MTNKERLRKVVDWLIYMGYARNEKEIAEKLGYTKSSFSQIINGRVPLSGRFVEKLSSADENINKIWITTGEGEMLKKSYAENSVTSTAAEAGARYGKAQAKGGGRAGFDLSGVPEVQTLLEMLKEKDRQIEVLQAQISSLINLLK